MLVNNYNSVTMKKKVNKLKFEILNDRSSS